MHDETQLGNGVGVNSLPVIKILKEIKTMTKEQQEFERLSELYKDISEDRRKLVEGLIVQAARLRVKLDELWSDISENGTTMLVTRGGTTTEQERPASKTFTALDKSYRSTLKQLDELLPEKSSSTGFSKLSDMDEE